MKNIKTTFGFVLALTMGTPIFVAAGEMEDAVMVEQQCKKTGKIGLKAYQARIKKKDYPDATKFEERYGAELLANTYGYYEATSAEDAYMRSWARCHDYFSAVQRSEERERRDRILYGD